MPCSYYSTGEYAEIQRSKLEARLDALKEELDKATALLCSISQTPQAKTLQKKLPAFAKWIEHHEAMDAARLAAEAEKQNKVDQENRAEVMKLLEKKTALSKLTTEQQKALGVQPLTADEEAFIEKFKHLFGF